MGGKRNDKRPSLQLQPGEVERGMSYSPLLWDLADEKEVDDGFTVVRPKHNAKQTETRVEVKQADLEDTSTKAEGKFMLQFIARHRWLTS